MADEGGASKGKKGKGKVGGDMLSEASLNNVYYGCHNVQELLEAKGYTHPEFVKKGKGKGKKGK